MLGLSGSHRTGKTTLAMEFAKRYDIPFVQTSASAVFELLGKDPKVDYPIEQRIAIQEAILYAFERQYAAAAKMAPLWISDRTPIDLASYMLADVQRETLAGNPAAAQHLLDYVERCLTATNQWFSTVVLVQPGIALVEAPGKAPCCPVNIEHLNALQAGLLLNEKLHARHFVIPRRYTELESRVQAVASATVNALNRHKEQMALAGIRIH